MFLRRSAIAAARRTAVTPVAARTFTTSFIRRTQIFPVIRTRHRVVLLLSIII